MNRTRKVVVGLAAATLMAGGVALAAPALAQADPEPADQCPYECPFDGDQLRERMHERMGQHDGNGPDGSGGMGNMMERRGGGHGPGPGSGDGTCPGAPETPDEGSSG